LSTTSITTTRFDTWTCGEAHAVVLAHRLDQAVDELLELGRIELGRIDLLRHVAQDGMPHSRHLQDRHRTPGLLRRLPRAERAGSPV
jgi:hypothetical protein